MTADQRADAALAWLSTCEERWLLVLDNLLGPDQLTGCCPSMGNGRVLVTTRDRAIDQFAPVLTVDVFDEETATEYLLARSDRADELAAAVHVARALGCLPLALAHAGAYCAQGTSLNDYLQLLEALPAAELFARSPEVFYRETVASTWQLSMQAAAAGAPLAADVLAMAALFAADDIPRTLFDALIDTDQPLQRKALIDAAASLHRFSLAVVTPSTMSVHRLLQRVVRDSDTTDRTRVGSAALSALSAALPGDPDLPDRWPAYEQIVPHILALGDASADYEIDSVALIGLLNGASGYLLRVGGMQRAIDATTLTTRHAQRLLGTEHPRTLSAYASLAFAYWSAGRTSDAIELQERVLADSERVLGTEHPDTLTARSNLAGSYWSAGRTSDAIELQERVLADSERVLGTEQKAPG